MSIAGCNSSDSNIITENETATPALQHKVLDKLVGTWQSEDGKSFERWTKKDISTYHSVGFSINGNDTSWNEKANIYRETGNWVFENTVKGQNEGRAVKFTSSLLNENSVQFSNSAHDFPTDINYTITDTNSLKAFIVGLNPKGRADTITFNFTRVY